MRTENRRYQCLLQANVVYHKKFCCQTDCLKFVLWISFSIDFVSSSCVKASKVVWIIIMKLLGPLMYDANYIYIDVRCYNTFGFHFLFWNVTNLREGLPNLHEQNWNCVVVNPDPHYIHRHHHPHHYNFDDFRNRTPLSLIFSFYFLKTYHLISIILSSSNSVGCVGNATWSPGAVAVLVLNL